MISSRKYPEITTMFQAALFSLLGVEWKYGGSLAKDGKVDCSGLVIECLHRVQVLVQDRTANGIMENYCMDTPKQVDFPPFPLLGFDLDSKGSATHVVCYMMASDTYIHAAKNVGIVHFGVVHPAGRIVKMLSPYAMLEALVSPTPQQGRR